MQYTDIKQKRLLEINGIMNYFQGLASGLSFGPAKTETETRIY